MVDVNLELVKDSPANNIHYYYSSQVLKIKEKCIVPTSAEKHSRFGVVVATDSYPFLWQPSSLKTDHDCARLIYNCFLWLIHTQFNFVYIQVHTASQAFFFFERVHLLYSTHWNEHLTAKHTPPCCILSESRVKVLLESQSILERLSKHWGADQFKIKFIGSRMYCFYCDCCTIVLPAGRSTISAVCFPLVSDENQRHPESNVSTVTRNVGPNFPASWNEP